MTDEQNQPQDTNQIIEERRAKLRELRAQDLAFPNDFSREHAAEELHVAYGGKSKEELEAAPVSVSVAGRRTRP